MDQIVSLTIGGVNITSFEKQNSVSLTLISPDLEDGEYILSGKTKSGENVEFLVGEEVLEETNVTIDRTAIVVTFDKQLKLGKSYQLIGNGMNKVESLHIGDRDITITEKTYEKLTFTCPENLDEGFKTLYCLSDKGKRVKFKTENGDVEEVSVLIGETLWEGKVYVSWEKEPVPAGSIKEFVEVKTMVQELPVGGTLKVHYSVKSDDTYHKMGTKTAFWNDLPGHPEFDFSENGVVEIVLTQDIVNLLKAEAGLIVVGHGYYVDRVTYEQ